MEPHHNQPEGQLQRDLALRLSCCKDKIKICRVGPWWCRKEHRRGDLCSSNPNASGLNLAVSKILSDFLCCRDLSTAQPINIDPNQHVLLEKIFIWCHEECHVAHRHGWWHWWSNGLHFLAFLGYTGDSFNIYCLWCSACGISWCSTA